MEFSALHDRSFARYRHHHRQIMISPEDTIAAIATPLGEGGLGVIRVSGTKAIGIVSKIFRQKAVNPAGRKPGSSGVTPLDPPLTSAGDDNFLNRCPSH